MDPAGVSYGPEDLSASFDCVAEEEANRRRPLDAKTLNNLPVAEMPEGPACLKFDLERVARPYPASIDFFLAVRVVRDVALGAIVPAFVVLIFPRIARRYWRWLTS